MSAGEVERFKNDLATLEKATGLVPLYGREDVWADLAVSAAGLVAVVWALLPHGLPQQWGVLPLVLVVVGYLTWQRARHRRGSGRSGMARKRYTAELIGTGVVVVLAVVYRLWANELGISREVAGGAALFMLGGAVLVFALRERDRWPDLGFAIPTMLCGLAIPMLSVSTWVLIGGAFAIGGAITAGAITYRLRMDANGHAAD